ncbi:MAG TPA: hypothetical protein VMJ12_06435 [Candidatus Acidoferrales bacterium]|nr:hypothetical protein [Candidatus Acidoferrales bacterium]
MPFPASSKTRPSYDVVVVGSGAAGGQSAYVSTAATGFYPTPRGWQDVQYIGNVAPAKFDGPPPEVRKYLNLT